MRGLVLSALALVVFTNLRGPAQAAGGLESSLIGLWKSEVVFGPEVRGVLTITNDRGNWRASIAGLETPVDIHNDTLTFSLQGNRGRFRGYLLQHRSRMIGYWIQPFTSHVWGSAYATPVEFRSLHKNVWKGQVSPLDDGEGMYLLIRREGPDSIGGFFRNPERNLGRYIGHRRVVCHGKDVYLINASGSDTLFGRYDYDDSTLSIFFPTESGTFDFTRSTRDEATGFYERVWGGKKYVYRPPDLSDDGWEVASLGEVGMDTNLVGEVVQSVIDTEINDVNAPYMHSFLIARHGKLVLEEYFSGFYQERPHDLRSAGKTLTSTLVGIALESHETFKVGTPIYSLLPGDTNAFSGDERKRKVTVENLFTMTSGFDGNDDSSSSSGNEDNVLSQRNVYEYTLHLPMTEAPGEHGVYFSAGINLLGDIIQTVTRTWLPDFFFRKFAEPLGIRYYHINLDDLGNAYMGGGIQMRPRDFLKLGQLFLNGGKWNGRQILSERWIAAATRAHSSVYAKDDYGYAWWVRCYEVDGKSYSAYQAAGNGGQTLTVIPDLDLIVLFTGGNYNQGPVWWKWGDDLIPKYIIPSVKR